MRRLRFLRILLPLLLLPFLLWLALTFRERPAPHSRPEAGTALPGPRAERIELTDLSAGAPKFSVKARVVEQDARGGYHMEGVDRVLIERERASPLVVRAERGGVEGSPGRRLMTLEGGVQVDDAEQGLKLSLPTLLVDESAGEARSAGQVTVETRRLKGHADSVIYGLKEQPTRLAALGLRGDDGASLAADEAVMLDGLKDVELIGRVRVADVGATVVSGRMRVRRSPQGKLRSASASEGTEGSLLASGTTPSRFRSDRVDVEWDAEGGISRVLLQGNARVQQGSGALTASSIEARKRAGVAAVSWDVSARGSVRAEGSYRVGSSLLLADAADATLDGDGTLLRGTATGNVRFEGSGTAAGADRADYETRAGLQEVTLLSGSGGRARLARDRSRVTADRVVTDPEGTRMEAEGRVEASLLPEPDGTGVPRANGFFQAREAVHFVAARMASRSSDGRLDFDGEVRGWQGERNLSADHVDVRQGPDELHARGHVVTRIPTAPAASVSESDFIRVGAERLDYRESDAKVVYTGAVRVRRAEGWLDGASVEIVLDRQGGDAKEILASGKVRFEYRAHVRPGSGPPVTGEGDRAVFLPPQQLLRLFGDERPASVRREGERGGTTTGRVLRYRLDDGTLEVESGERDRARVRTSGQ